MRRAYNHWPDTVENHLCLNLPGYLRRQQRQAWLFAQPGACKVFRCRLLPIEQGQRIEEATPPLQIQMNRQALEEELTVQEVILDSLQDEAGEDAEVQRDEARREIVRLKRMLRTLSMTAAGGEAGQDTSTRACHDAVSCLCKC